MTAPAWPTTQQPTEDGWHVDYHDAAAGMAVAS